MQKRRNKNGLSGGIIAIIALSTFAAVALCSAAAWVFLFKHGDRASEPTPTPQALLPSVGKPSGNMNPANLIKLGLVHRSVCMALQVP